MPHPLLIRQIHRYHHAKNHKTPRKIDSQLILFDCINCDKCVPVCPNNANFAYELMPQDLTYNDWMVGTDGTVTPLHFDSYDNFLVQVVGSARVIS